MNAVRQFVHFMPPCLGLLSNRRIQRIAISDFLRNKNPNLLSRVKEHRKCFQLKKELKILNSKMIEYGMNLNVTQSKAKFIIQMAGRPLIPLKVDQLDKVKAFHCHILNWRVILEQFVFKT